MPSSKPIFLPPPCAEPRSFVFSCQILTASLPRPFSSLLVNLTVKLQITFLAKLTIGRLPLNRLRAIEIAEMTSYLSRLSLMPGFPEYTGPHKVGTIDVELPVSDLDCPSPSPDESISTVQYRIFYPCQPDAKGKKNVNWLPAPQRGYISAYTKFLGAGSMLAELIW
jgi:hypothetical protein